MEKHTVKLNKTLESDINKLTNKSWKDDIALVVEDKQLYTNRSILAYASPVFDAMFSGEYKEKDAKEIPLPGKKFDDVIEFLRCITPGMMRSITMKNVLIVLKLASEYQVVCLEPACEVVFVQHLAEYPESDQVYEILEKAVSYGLKEVKEKCTDIIAERPREEFEEAERGFKFPEDVSNMVRAKTLRTLQKKYKDVFGHVQTSRALYQFLGLEAKQNDLVKRYMDGNVMGNCTTIKVSSPFEASTDMLIDKKKFHIDIKQIMNMSDIYTRVSVKSDFNEAPIDCLVAVYITNWMHGKEYRRHIEEIKLRGDSKSFRIPDSSVDLLKKEEAGFMYKGTLEFLIYLFCLK